MTYDRNRLVEENAGLVKLVQSKFPKDEELYQVGMIALWEAAQKWDGIHSFHPWAKRVIRHRMIDCMRRRRAREEELNEERESDYQDMEDTRDEIRRCVKEIFPRRSRERRVVLSLLSGKSKQQIAKRMGISVQTVRRISKRAYMEIKKRRE